MSDRDTSSGKTNGFPVLALNCFIDSVAKPFNTDHKTIYGDIGSPCLRPLNGEKQSVHSPIHRIYIVTKEM